MRHNYTRCNYSSSLVNFTIERFAAAAASISARQRLMNSKANYQFWFFFLFFLHKPAHFCRTMWINILSSPSLFSLPAHRVPRNLEMNIILRLSFLLVDQRSSDFSEVQPTDPIIRAATWWKTRPLVCMLYTCVLRATPTPFGFIPPLFSSPGYSSLSFFYPEKIKRMESTSIQRPVYERITKK
jgi:hypothetical protein